MLKAFVGKNYTFSSLHFTELGHGIGPFSQRSNKFAMKPGDKARQAYPSTGCSSQVRTNWILKTLRDSVQSIHNQYFLPNQTLLWLVMKWSPSGKGIFSATRRIMDEINTAAIVFPKGLILLCSAPLPPAPCHLSSSTLLCA